MKGIDEVIEPHAPMRIMDKIRILVRSIQQLTNREEIVCSRVLSRFYIRPTLEVFEQDVYSNLNETDLKTILNEGWKNE